MKRHLEEAIGLPEVPNGPKPILRLAHENRLLPGNIEDWIEYANLRVATAHDYSGEKAPKALARMTVFVKIVVALRGQNRSRYLGVRCRSGRRDSAG